MSEELLVCSRRLAAASFLATVLTGCAPVRSGVPGAPPTGADVVLPYVGGDTGAAPRGRAGATPLPPAALAGSARIGPNDLLEISLLEAPEMNRTVRVSQTGGITLPLLGEVTAGGQTPRELEVALEARLRERYVRDPHVSVQLTEMQSHGVAVVGAVAKPGVFQVREPRSLLEVIALAGGLTEKAGDAVIVVRGGSTSDAADDGERARASGDAREIRLRELLDSGDPRHNIMVHPGDLVKIAPAGVVYVIGDVRKPGAFPLERGTVLTALQAIALGEGFAARASKSRARIIRTADSGERSEIPVDLGDVIAGRAADIPLQSRDVVYVPSSTAKNFTIGAIDALLRVVTLRAVF